jgi:hypothetical protein
MTKVSGTNSSKIKKKKEIVSAKVRELVIQGRGRTTRKAESTGTALSCGF